MQNIPVKKPRTVDGGKSTSRAPQLQQFLGHTRLCKNKIFLRGRVKIVQLSVGATDIGRSGFCKDLVVERWLRV